MKEKFKNVQEQKQKTETNSKKNEHPCTDSVHTLKLKAHKRNEDWESYEQ